MRLRLIACNVVVREACLCIAGSPHTVDPVFTDIGEHVHPEILRARLQGLVDDVDAGPTRYDAVLLLFGICGNAGVDLRAGRVPLVMPRAHDCCTLLLGSRRRFAEEFGADPSKPFSSSGYMERGDYWLRTADDQSEAALEDPYQAYVDQYGEENAKYIWEMMHPDHSDHGITEAVFIDLAETSGLGFAEKFRQQAESEGRDYVRLEGSLRLIRGLINGDWPEEEFLITPPGGRIAGVYDMDQIVRSIQTDAGGDDEG